MLQNQYETFINSSYQLSHTNLVKGTLFDSHNVLISFSLYIYMYAFSRRFYALTVQQSDFYPKRLTVLWVADTLIPVVTVIPIYH